MADGNGTGDLTRFGTINCAEVDCQTIVAYFPVDSDLYDEDTELYCRSCATALDRVES